MPYKTSLCQYSTIFTSSPADPVRERPPCSTHWLNRVFDRGVPDVMGYLLLSQLPVPAHIEKAAHLFKYNRYVFMAPPWKEIFIQDDERTQTFAEAEATYDSLVNVYVKLGYTPLPLPLDTIAERVQFVLKNIDHGPEP